MSAPQWPKTLKRTKQRLLVWEKLGAAKAPLSALELFEGLREDGESVWLSTVYRVLDTLAEHGLATKTAVLDGGTVLYECSGLAHTHYAVCVSCKRAIPMACCPLHDVELGLQESDFVVTGHRLQMFGYCSRCRQEKP